MWYVYILYSVSSGKTYVGYSGDVNRRIFEHNVSETKGFTLRYRPWSLIRSEGFKSKSAAMQREKYLKTGKGRSEVKEFVVEYLRTGAVSAVAEKD